jgi:hypothetical protein
MRILENTLAKHPIPLAAREGFKRGRRKEHALLPLAAPYPYQQAELSLAAANGGSTSATATLLFPPFFRGKRESQLALRWTVASGHKGGDEDE